MQFTNEDGGIEPDYYVTCKLFGILPVKDIAVTYVENEAVFASGTQVGIYAKTKGTLLKGCHFSYSFFIKKLNRKPGRLIIPEVYQSSFFFKQTPAAAVATQRVARATTTEAVSPVSGVF